MIFLPGFKISETLFQKLQKNSVTVFEIVTF